MGVIDWEALFKHECANFKKWLNVNRQLSIGYNYKEAMALMESKIKQESLFPSGIKSETKKDKFIEKIYLNDLLGKKYKGLKHIELQPDISNYFWLENLIECGHCKNDLWEVFKDKKFNEKNYLLELYSKRLFKHKYALIIDAALISIFTHDICLMDGDDAWADSIKVIVNESGRSALEKLDKIDETRINEILSDIEDISTHYEKGFDKSILKLVRHLVPLIIFIIANLPINEKFNDLYDNVRRKLFPIILTICQDVLTLDSIDKYLADKRKVDLHDIQRKFLLAAYDSKRKPFKLALTKRSKGEKTYPQRYNKKSIQTIALPLGEDNKPGKAKTEKVEIERNYNSLPDLFSMYSEAVSSYNRKSRSISPQLSMEVFINLLDSCEIWINKKPFYFNKSMNLVIFNSLTRLIDAHLQVEEEGGSIIYGLNGLLSKRAVLESNSNMVLTMNDVDRLNMIMWSIENMFSNSLNSIEDKIDFDPYEDYKESIFVPMHEPKPKREKDDSFILIFESTALISKGTKED